MQQSPALLVRHILSKPHTLPAAEQPTAGLPRLDIHKARQGGADDATGQGEEEIDRHGVVVQRAVGERIQCGLDELAET